jgi:hypothetical protein
MFCRIFGTFSSWVRDLRPALCAKKSAEAIGGSFGGFSVCRCGENRDLHEAMLVFLVDGVIPVSHFPAAGRFEFFNRISSFHIAFLSY